MGWWWVVWFVASIFIQRALAPKPEKPQPKGLSDFDLPTVDASRAVPVIFGTCKITGPNVLWYGDFQAVSTETQEGAPIYFYCLGLDLAVCHGPVDEVVRVLHDDKTPEFTYIRDIAGGKLYRQMDMNLFGGETSGGGVSGYIGVYPGAAGQAPSSYMRSVCSADYPGYPGLCHLVFFRTQDQRLGFMLGTSESIHPISVIATRCPNGLGLTGGHHRIADTAAGYGYDANPACMLYEILTDSVWGLGEPAAKIDADSFRAVGETLFAEGLGLTMILEQRSDANDAISEILRHVDGDLFQHPQTGLYTLALSRADYDPEGLPTLDQSSLSAVELSRGSWSETSNTVRVTYTSRADNYTDRVAQWQNLANLQVQGNVVSTQLEFRGLSNAKAASLVAARALKAVSWPLASLKLTANRAAWALRPGSVFKLHWAPLGISGMVCRVSKIAYGELTDGKITIDAVEDAFGISGTAYSDPPGTAWVDPVGDPVAVDAQKLLELPHQLAGGAEREVLALAARDSGALLGYQVWSDPAGGTNYSQTASVPGFSAYAELEEDMPADRPAVDTDGEWTLADVHDATLLESASEDEFLAGVNLCLIDDEIMAWRYYDPATAKLKCFMRGVLDTVPADHGAGSKVWFLRSPLPLVNPVAPYQSDLTVAAKLLTFTLRHTLALSAATAMSLATASRALKPLAPGRVRVNGEAWPSSVTGDAVVTWNHRHRTVQTAAGVLVSQDADDVATAPEGTYTVQVRVGGVLRRTVTGLTGKTWTWTAAMQTADGASAGSTCAIRIVPVNGSLSGTYQEREFQLA
jgi:hypothetical protein